jgi:hypothetical protein
MPDASCQEFARLEAEAHATLKKIGELAAAQLQAFSDREEEEFTRLDRELELTVGHKERVIGALREHAADHGCRPPFLPEL